MEKTEFNAKNVARNWLNVFGKYLEEKRKKEELLRKQALSDFKILLTEEMKKKIEEQITEQSKKVEDLEFYCYKDHKDRDCISQRSYRVFLDTEKDLTDTQVDELGFQIKSWLLSLGFIDITHNRTNEYMKNSIVISAKIKLDEADDLL
jgi:hypothetical protein